MPANTKTIINSPDGGTGFAIISLFFAHFSADLCSSNCVYIAYLYLWILDALLLIGNGLFYFICFIALLQTMERNQRKVNRRKIRQSLHMIGSRLLIAIERALFWKGFQHFHISSFTVRCPYCSGKTILACIFMFYEFLTYNIRAHSQIS